MEKLKTTIKEYFSNGPKAIFLVTIILMGITVYICSQRKMFTVIVDGNQKEVITFKRTYAEALKSNNIVIGSKDKTSALLNSKIKNGEQFAVKRAVNVKVDVDGKILNIKTAENTVDDMLTAEGINVRENDKVSPSFDEPVADGLKVVITRLDMRMVKETKSIDFATVIRKDDNSEKGTEKILQKGEKGEKEVSVRILYQNGKEVARSIIGEIVKKAPVDKIVALGTLGVYSTSRGTKVLFKNQLRMWATAYSADYSSTGKRPGDYGYGITATGTLARRNENGYSSVAVDPRVIPLGTKLYIPGYGYAVAEDIGSAIKGKKIDLYFNSESELYNNWSVRWVDVYILK